MLGKSEGKRKRRQQRMRWLESSTNPMDMNLSKFWQIDLVGFLSQEDLLDKG